MWPYRCTTLASTPCRSQVAAACGVRQSRRSVGAWGAGPRSKNWPRCGASQAAAGSAQVHTLLHALRTSAGVRAGSGCSGCVRV